MNYRKDTVKTDTFEMEYLTFGKKDKAFVILPGMSMKSVLLASDGIYEHYEEYTDRYTVYLFERKKNIQSGYSIKDMADDTAEAMKKLNIEKADIYGASQGGMIALCLAIYHPELVNKMVVASSMSRNNNVSKKTFRNWSKLAEENNYYQINKSGFENMYCEETQKMFEGMIDYNDGTDEECARYRILSDACLNFDVYDQLDRIKCPILVLGSNEDRILDRKGSLEISKKLKCQFYMYDGYGHAVYDEAPDFRERMMRFYEQ